MFLRFETLAARWRTSVVAAAAILAVTGCKKKEEPKAEPTPAPQAKTEAGKAEAAAVPAGASPTVAEAAAVTPDKAAGEADPLKNGWDLPARGTSAKDGDRVFVLTQGKDRSYGNASAVYHLFAYDMGEVKGDLTTVKELGGGSFKVTGLFVIPAGTEKPEDLKVGDMVLAEWASSLKHAMVTKVEGDKITVHYTDLPDSWSEDKLMAVLGPRQVTRQKDGLHPGNFAVAKDEEGRGIEVLLVQESGDKWLTRKFAGRVAAYDKKDLVPIPVKPALKAGQLVQVPWVGMMYKGKVKKVTGTKVEVAVEGIATKEPVVTSMGQVLPDAGK
jgi:hypothetical protein